MKRLCGVEMLVELQDTGQAHVRALARALRRVRARAARRALPGIEGAADQLHQALPVRWHRRHLTASDGCLQDGSRVRSLPGVYRAFLWSGGKCRA